MFGIGSRLAPFNSPPSGAFLAKLGIAKGGPLPAHFGYGAFWSVVLMALHEFSADYTVWLLFSFGALGVAHSIGLDRSSLLAAFLAYAVVLASAASALTPAPMTNPFLFSGCLVCFAGVLFLALSARRLAEQDLVESEERNRAVLIQSSDGVCLVDVETYRFLDTNPAFRKMVGYSAEELRERTITELDAEGEDAVETRAQELLAAGESDVGERTLRHKDGSLVKLSFSIDVISYDGHDVFCAVARDIREQKQTERALRRAKERAAETLHIKTNLLNNMSHELRTPLTGILGFADVLVEETDGKHQEHARVIAESGQRLRETIRAVMDLAGLDKESATLELQPLDLTSEVREVTDLLAPQAEERGLYLNVVEHASSPVHARVDRAAFARTLRNVVGNAIKFTERGGVTVTLDSDNGGGSDSDSDDGAAVVRVSDTGIGIDDAFQSHLFEEFKQESTGLGRSHEGIGIGLTITRRLVELMDGEIAVESEKGVGSTFTLRFPRRRAPAGAAGYQAAA
jgi:PAS domain S-box-containing protein